MYYFLIFAGLVGLFLGGEALVRGGVSIASRLSVSPLVIGLTVVGFGTSMPELLVSVQAALGGVPDVAIGNVVGSNIANILLIVGVTALVWPIRVKVAGLWRDLAVMLAAALLLVLLFSTGSVGRGAGAILLASLVAYLVWTVFGARGGAQDEDTGAPMALPVALIWAGGGLVGVLVGAHLLVDGAVSVAQTFGVSEAFIGLTVVAVGTSLPELATSVVAALRRQSDLAIGNVIGSNIFNVLGILGITVIITPIPVADRFLVFDLPVMLGASIGLIALLVVPTQIGRIAGACLLLAYAVYTVSAL